MNSNAFVYVCVCARALTCVPVRLRMPRFKNETVGSSLIDETLDIPSKMPANIGQVEGSGLERVTPKASYSRSFHQGDTWQE